MKKELIKSKINEGYKVVVCLQPTKKYDKVTLKSFLKSDKSNVVYPVYYNHCKDFLTSEQIRLISLYNKVKDIQYKDLVELNVRKNKNTLSKDDIEIMVMNTAIKKIEYLELI